MQKILLQNSYFNILEMLDQQPWSEQMLNALIQLESDIKAGIFDILQNYQKQNKEMENTKTYQAIHGTVLALRNTLEARIMQIATGDKVSIHDLLNQCIINLNKILENQENIEDILKNMKIYFRKVEETILPPDEQQVQTGSWNWWFEKKEWCNKFGSLITLLRKNEIYTDDLFVITWVNQLNQMREETYLYIHIPRINKTILINNGYGEKTFIYDGYIEVEYFLNTTKKWIKQNENIVSVNFDYEDSANWETKMRYYLFEKGKENKDGWSVWKKVNIKDFLRVPEWWYTNKSLATNLSVAPNTIKNIVKLYRETNPEYLKKYLDNHSNLREYYAPELCKIIEEEIKNRWEESPEWWFTNNALAEKLEKNKDAIKKIAKKYIVTNPERFKEYINKLWRIREYYHPELCKIIEEEIENRWEKAPEWWKNNNKLASDLWVDFDSVKKIAESYRWNSLDWFVYYLDNINNLREYYAPELCKIVEEEIEIKNRWEKAPEWWKNNNKLRLELTESFYVVKDIANKYRETNLLWFKQYLDNHNNLREYYHPELCEIIRKEAKNRGEKSPKWWETNKWLADKIGTSEQSIKLVIEKYREKNTERFKEYLDKNNRLREHYHPELCKIVKKEIENRWEKSPKWRNTNKWLAKEIGVDPLTIKGRTEKYRETNPERFKDYLDKMNRKTIHYSPEFCEIIKKELQK